jgi:hypothetical protein
MKNETFSLDGIEYNIDKLYELDYTIQKMSEYLQQYGLEKSIRSQRFIRHLHLHIAMKLQRELGINPEDILFETKLRNKNVDIAVVQQNEVKLAITVRSQSSSIKANFTNNINSLQGEVVSLKTYYPNAKVGLVYLIKKTDEKGDCEAYLNENIPKKLLPLINSSIPTKDRFDTAMIVIWDYDETSEKVKLIENNIFTKVYNEENFIKDIKNILEEEKINSQFSLKELDKDKIIEFLKSN